ncbi:MAG: histidine phosphatase family protein [Pseudomonadota bacterium]
MKRLGLLRHAKSEWDDMVKRDFDRGLNERGRRGAALMGEHVVAEDFAWDMAIASPATRVRETLANARLGLSPVFDDRLYLASPDTIVEVLHAQAGDADANASEPESVLLIGHNPGLQETILNLVAPARENDLFREAVVKFPTATFAVLECAIDSWRELKPRCATLVHFARPRDLDTDLGPAT